MIDAGHSSLEFIWDHSEPVADLNHAMNGPKERQSNQDRSKDHRVRCHGKKRPQQREEPAHPEQDGSQAEPVLQGGSEQSPEGVASSSEREDQANEGRRDLLPLGEHNHDEGTGGKDQIEAAGDHRERSNDRLVPHLAPKGAWRLHPLLLKGGLDEEEGAGRDDIGERISHKREDTSHTVEQATEGGTQ